MAYFIAQTLFAIVFYPLFLILLSVIATFFTVTPASWKKVTGLILFVASGAATYLSLNFFESPGAEVALYLIASTVFFVFLGHYFCIMFTPNAKHRGNLVYCLILVFILLLDLLLVGTGKFSPLRTQTREVVELIFLIDILRWPLTLILAVWTTIQYKAYLRFIIIALSSLAYAGLLSQVLPFVLANL